MVILGRLVVSCGDLGASWDALGGGLGMSGGFLEAAGEGAQVLGGHKPSVWGPPPP